MGKLFVYAELKEGAKGEAAEAFGQLRMRPNGDGAARFGLEYETTVKGIIIDEADAKEGKLDKFEAPEFKREKILLKDYNIVDAYPYVKNDWGKLPVVPDGDWTKRLEKETKDGNKIRKGNKG